MDAELHRVPHTVREIQEALLLVRTTGMDILRHNVRNFLDPQ
jgi:hypothetical protein